MIIVSRCPREVDPRAGNSATPLQPMRRGLSDRPSAEWNAGKWSHRYGSTLPQAVRRLSEWLASGSRRRVSSAIKHVDRATFGGCQDKCLLGTTIVIPKCVCVRGREIWRKPLTLWVSQRCSYVASSMAGWRGQCRRLPRRHAPWLRRSVGWCARSRRPAPLLRHGWQMAWSKMRLRSWTAPLLPLTTTRCAALKSSAPAMNRRLSIRGDLRRPG